MHCGYWEAGSFSRVLALTFVEMVTETVAVQAFVCGAVTDASDSMFLGASLVMLFRPVGTATDVAFDQVSIKWASLR